MEFPVSYELKDNARSYHFGKEVHINSFVFLDKETASFEVGEPIRFSVRFSSTKEVHDASLVLSIKTSEIRQIGMCFSKPFDIRIGEDQEVTFEADLSALAQGKYCLNFEIVEIDSTGNYYSYDNPYAKIFIEMNNAYAHGIRWNRNYWASVSFPRINIR